MKIYLKPILIVSSLSIFLFFLVVSALAQEDAFESLTYPIPELGNCESIDACEAFCGLSGRYA